jgi:TRAP-type uncharacterized transport system fused permease subunit
LALAAGSIGFAATKALWWERIMLICGALLSMHPAFSTDALGLAMIVAALVSNFMRRKKNDVEVLTEVKA